jgi:glycosyltransferase involved in cell wall biosynthesis
MKPLNILVLTAYPPALGVHGGALRMYYNLKILAARHQVTLISFIEREAEWEQLKRLEASGIEVKALLRRAEPVRNLWVPKPHEHAEFASCELNRLVHQTLRERSFDVVQVEFLQMAQHVPQDLPILKVLTEHEILFENFHVDFALERCPWKKAQKLYHWMVQLNYEVRACRQFDRIACMTDQDRKALSRFVSPDKLRTVPIGVDSDYFDPGHLNASGIKSPRMLFVGSYRHTPNRDAVHFFITRILPAVHRELPDAEFWVVGGNMEMLDQRLLQSSDKIQAVGYVPDVRSCYQDAAVFVAPILTGTGMRVKLLEAFSMGMAVIATPLAAQGFESGNCEVLSIAGGADHFAAETVRLLRDPQLRCTLGANARRMIRGKYDWKVIERQFLNLVEEAHA